MFLSLTVTYYFFDTLYFRVLFCFFNFSNVFQLFIMYLNLRVYLFVFDFVNFSNVPLFSVKIKVSDWVERKFSSLAVFSGNLR